MLKSYNSMLTLWVVFILSACGAKGQDPYSGTDRSMTNDIMSKGLIRKFEKDGRYGFKDEGGNIIVNPVYNQLPNYPYEFMAVWTGLNCGLINYMGDTIIEFGKYQTLNSDHILPFNAQANGVHFFRESADVNWVCQKNGLFGMIDRYDSILLPIEYEKYEYIFSNSYAFYKNDSVSVYNSKGQHITTKRCDKVSQIFNTDYFIYKKDSLQGLYNININKDVLGWHDLIITFESDIIGTKDSNHYTLYNLEGDRISPITFDTLYIHYEINSPVSKSTLEKYKQYKIIGWAKANGKLFLINKEGDAIEVL